LARQGGGLAAVGALLLAVAGCGGGEGVAPNATVAAYVDASLCAGARQELAREGGRAGDVRVHAVCLSSAGRGGRLILAAVGANARRATEDSTAIAFLEAPGRASRFSDPILESAGIAWIHASSGETGMARLLHAVREVNSGLLRQSVREALHQV
jgi:hypothetical protein